MNFKKFNITGVFYRNIMKKVFFNGLGRELNLKFFKAEGIC